MMRPIISVVIPCFRVRHYILDVIAGIGHEVSRIYVVDDCCPERSGDYVEENCKDKRVTVIRNSSNYGVGGAVMAGYKVAIADGADVIVKIDGDGQMDPGLIMGFVSPILSREADYAKGNRFFDLEEIRAMPKMRIFGNAVLSFITKFSSGYWNIFDPTNGYTAIHRDVAMHLPFEKISRSYFFETDMLFRLNTIRAVVVDVPMDARYGEEVSNLKYSRVLGEFLWKNTINFSKRVFYNYYLRDMSIASIELPLGLGMLIFGLCFGVFHWFDTMQTGTVNSAGTVMLSALPLITGMQLLLAFISQDIRDIPKRSISRKHLYKLQ